MLNSTTVKVHQHGSGAKKEKKPWDEAGEEWVQRSIQWRMDWEAHCGFYCFQGTAIAFAMGRIF